MGKKKPKTQSIARGSRSDADRRVRQAARLGDLMRLLQLLLGRGRWDVKSLSAELECSERTVYRRLQALELAGVPYFYDSEQRCIRVLPGVKFPVLQLTRDELLQQATATAVSKAPGLRAGASGTATPKIAAASTEEVAQLLADAQSVVAALDLKLADHSKHQELLTTIQWALIERRQIAGSYYTPHKRKTVDLTLHPYRVCLTGQAWYLIARPAGEDHPKTYRVPRFQSVRPLDAAAEVPEDFDLAAYFGNAWNVYRGERTHEVEIQFAPDAAELVAETVWHKTQQVVARADGSVTLKFTVDGLDEIVWWVLGWTGRAKVIRPPELRNLVVGKLREGLESHGVRPQ